MSPLALLAGALALDLLVGEPPNALHPVVWMGTTARALERIAPERRPARQLAWGALVALGVPVAFTALAALLLGELDRWPIVAFLVGVLLLKTTFALRALGRAARVVRDALARGEVEGARRGLRSLCSRDPAALDEPALVAATIESVAENASDSFVAPLFYFALFGVPGAVFYRAANTLDALLGYHGRYEWLGKPAARLDDLLNLVPARLTALALLAAGGLAGCDVRGGWRVLRRDGGRTESPNAGRPMAAMAGLLGVELEKRGHYRLGEPRRPLSVGTIEEAWRVVRIAAATSVLAALVALGVGHGAR